MMSEVAPDGGERGDEGDAMPVFAVYFHREFDLLVEAESREAAEAAAQTAIDDGDVDEFCSYEDEWAASVSSKPVLGEAGQGIKKGRIVHISDVEEANGDE